LFDRKASRARPLRIDAEFHSAAVLSMRSQRIAFVQPALEARIANGASHVARQRLGRAAPRRLRIATHCASALPVAWRALSSAQRSRGPLMSFDHAARNAGQSSLARERGEPDFAQGTATAWPL
jgi:hypothetical protein